MDRAQYNELLKLIELSTIEVASLSFSKGASCKPGVVPDDIDISRGVSEPQVSNSILRMPVGFKIKLKKKKSLVMNFQIILEIVFRTSNETRLKEILEDADVRSFFCGYQSDKIAWSYLRCYFDSACSAAGIRVASLPLLR